MVDILWANAGRFQVQPGCCDCFWCRGAVPQEMQVVLSGLGNDGCNACAALNGTYICQLETSFLFPFVFGTKQVRGAKDCFWAYYFDPIAAETCTAAAVVVAYELFAESGSFLEVSINWFSVASGSTTSWRIALPEKPLCFHAAETVLPFFTHGGDGFGICNADGSSATVTALPNP
jgi:hypothetical protein